MAIFDKKTTIHFGQRDALTFIDHRDEKKKKAWIARHRVKEDWTNIKKESTL